MMLHRLHVSAVASELEIAAFCMRQREKFTHIINLTFTSPPVDSANNIAPSDWSWKETEMCLPTDGQGFRPSRLRLTCPDFLCRLGEHQSTLTVQQFRAARDYMKRAFPDMPADWARDEQLDMPFVPTPEYAEGTRVLIVGPPDRSVDVMGILIRYLSFLTGKSPSVLLDRVQRPTLIHKHWRFRPLAETSSGTGVERR
ncbi:hypothetical protein J3R83DRAFT_3788 [Lanmaoa asiatica]|nr:hypothetical protein J3R83DRAFT_3788 [Lanmaoa asiatica]